MIRNATLADIRRIIEIRATVRENRLRDPGRVTMEALVWFIENPGIFVCEQDGRIVGFSAADPRNGSIFALFVDPDFEKRGLGRRLFEQACTVLKAANWQRMWLTTSVGTRAERFYRKAGWRVTGTHDGQRVFETTEPLQ